MTFGGRHILPFLAAAALPLGPLAAQQADCTTLRLLAHSENDLSYLSLQYRWDGLLDVQLAGRADLLSGANACDIAGADSFSIKCKWSSDARADAEARFKLFRAKIDECLPGAEMTLEQNTYNSNSMKVLESYSGKAGADEYGAGGATIAMQFVEFTSFFGKVSYSVDLSLKR